MADAVTAGRRSWRLPGQGRPLELTADAVPEPVGTEVLVRVDRCGLCHSDLHLQDGLAPVPLPVTLGHEIAGTVVRAGPGAEGVRPGDKRAVYPWIGCGRCPPCLDGDDVACVAPRFLGLRADGGFSDHVLVAHPRYLLDHGGLSQEQAATAGCSVLTAYGALKKVLPRAASDWIAVIGAGGVGLAAVALARRLTEARVLAVDVGQAQLLAARAAGAHETVLAGGGAEAVVAATGGGAAAAIDFVGSAATAELAVASVRRRGTVVVVGLHGGDLVLPLQSLPRRMLTVTGSFVGTLAEMQEVMAVLRSSGGLGVPVTTRPLAEVNAAMDALRAGRVVGRVVFDAARVDVARVDAARAGP